MNQDKIEFCFQCPKYPCPLYKQIDVYDSFITHLHQKQDLNKIQFLGIDQYTALQKEKAEILHHLLAFHNDGRHKTFFCLAVNLLEMDDLRQALCQPDVIESLREAANQKHIVLKLRRKKKSTP
jgi:hypothetical protein